jgi:hypothetical protein
LNEDSSDNRLIDLRAGKQELLFRLAEAHGLTFADCVQCFGRDRDGDPFARGAAAGLAEASHIEVPACTVVETDASDPDSGARVMAWIWVHPALARAEAEEATP